MIVLVAVNLIAAGSAIAGNVAEGEIPNADEIQAKDAALARKEVILPQQKTDIALKRASYGTGISVPTLPTSRNMLLGSLSGGTGAALVIPSAEITTEEIATINEDMSIMSRILEKNLQQAHINVGSMFIPSSDPWNFNVVFGRGKQATQGMYLQGYGALFLMKVDFPLSPGPQVEEEKETQQKDEEDVDPVWTEMKNEIFEPETSKRHKDERPKKEYDAEKVENLKTILTKALKHATNIRNLKPEESVILTITGTPVSSGYKSVRTIPGTNQIIVIDQNNRSQIIGADVVGDIGLSLPTVIVIRAKKSNIDRFAKGDLDFDQFQQNTQILTSTYLADQSSSGNPFSSYYFDYKTNR
jgi:hypothetical protein